jgi:8-oxo-dGTP pyrophosphatase MutT (NUDIX family)
MEPKRYKIRIPVYLVLVKDNKILLLRRINTGYRDGEYCLVSGHIDGNETLREAMIREAKEEIGITIKPKDLKFVHVLHRREKFVKGYAERIDVFFKPSKWQGEPINNEPRKCDDIKWFPIDNLPKNIFPYNKHVIECISKGIKYSEYGWEES